MAIAPNSEQALAIAIRRIYEDAELTLLSSISKRLVSGPGDVAEWQKQKLNQLGDMLRESRKITGELDRLIPKAIQQAIQTAYLSGSESAAEDLLKALEAINRGDAEMTDEIRNAIHSFEPPSAGKIGADATIETMSGINKEAIRALAGAATETLMATHVPLVRSVDDVYRRVVTDVVGTVLTGAETRREATQRILDKFAAGGIKVFRDKAGRNWDMGSYSEMATRAAIGQASLEGHMSQQAKFGFDLVQISDHHEECELCRPWEGKVLSVSGNTPGHVTLNQAISTGLFHPNCGHRGQTYFEGITTPLTKTADPVGYEQRKTQRYIERQIRGWKKRAAVAQTQKARDKADAKIAEWNETMKKFIDETDRKRKPERERIMAGREKIKDPFAKLKKVVEIEKQKEAAAAAAKSAAKPKPKEKPKPAAKPKKPKTEMIEFPSGAKREMTHIEHNGIKIKYPVDANKKRQKLTPDDIISFIGQIPKEHQDVIADIHLIDDYDYEKGRPLKESLGAYVRATRAIEFYRNDHYKKEEVVKIYGDTLRHEVGHSLAAKMGPQFEKEWKKAIKKEGGHITDYAATDLDEDIAETIMFHWSPDRMERRTVEMFFPERFKVLQKYGILPGGGQ